MSDFKTLVLPPRTLFALREFYEAWGHRAVVSGESVWFDGGSFSMMSIPTLVIPKVRRTDVDQLLLKTGKLASVYGVENTDGMSVPLYVLTDKNYGWNHLQRQYRQQVKKASLHMTARPCTWIEWEQSASRCDSNTLSRRGKKTRANHPLLNAKGRSKISEIAQSIPELGLYGCFCGREIVAYIAYLKVGSICEGIFAHRCNDDEASSRYAAHLLFFEFARFAIGCESTELVCVGRQSVPANKSLERFKLHAGFEAVPYFLRMQMHPYVTPFLQNRLSEFLLYSIRKVLSPRFSSFSNLEVLERACCRIKD